MFSDRSMVVSEELHLKKWEREMGEEVRLVDLRVRI